MKAACPASLSITVRWAGDSQSTNFHRSAFDSGAIPYLDQTLVGALGNIRFQPQNPSDFWRQFLDSVGGTESRAVFWKLE